MANIDKITSHADLSCVDEEQLFTELTAEEGAVVEGGKATLDVWLFVKKPFEDDPVLRVGGKTLGSAWNAKQNAYVFKDREVEFSFDTTITVWDRDPGGSQNDDLLMFQHVKESEKGKGWKSKTAEGYTLWHRVI